MLCTVTSQLLSFGPVLAHFYLLGRCWPIFYVGPVLAHFIFFMLGHAGPFQLNTP
jgi:hypothetical protein